MDLLRFLMMASTDDSGSPQYLVFQPLPDGLSYRQRDKHLKNILVADLRSAFVLIAELDVRDKGHKGPQDQYSIYGDHAIGVMPSVIRASPRDRWPDKPGEPMVSDDGLRHRNGLSSCHAPAGQRWSATMDLGGNSGFPPS